MKLKVNRERHIDHMILIWSGYFKITKLEHKLLAAIILHHVELSEKIKDVELFNKNFMDSEFRAYLMELLEIKAPQLTTYLNKLKEKKVLKEEEGTYYINNKFMPKNKLVFEFEYE